MKRIAVRDAKPGMLLARPITDKQGRTIVAEGTRLSQLYISRLEKWSVEELFVAEEGAREPAAPAGATGAPAPAPAGPAAPPPGRGAEGPAAAGPLSRSGAGPSALPRSAPAGAQSPAAAPRPAGPKGAAPGGLPPGVYRGADLPERLARTFSRVQGDPLMAALHAAVRKQLLAGREGGG